MNNITYDLIKELRKRSNAKIIDCKNALIKSQGNIELAIENLRKSGQTTVSKKFNKIAVKGIIISQISKDKKYGVIIELNCETDFVAKTPIFTNFSKEIIFTAINEKIKDIEILKNKFELKLNEIRSILDENINIRRLGILEEDTLCCYLHRKYIGVIVSARNIEERLIKQIAMHIAASKPEYINFEDVPNDVISNEYNIQLEIAIKYNKSKYIANKIAEGRVKKFISEISLVGQNFVINPKETVGQLLLKNNAKINKFIRFEVGEDISI